MTDKTPRWITSWPEWYGIKGNVEVVPACHLDALKSDMTKSALAAECERIANHPTAGFEATDDTSQKWRVLLRMAALELTAAPPEERAHCVTVSLRFVKAVSKLVFEARISGGTAGRNESLCQACEDVERLYGEPDFPAHLSPQATPK